MKKLLLGCSALVLLAACDPATVTSTNSGETAATETTAMADIGTWGFDVDGMDANYHPGDDFFRYANGTWLDNTTIPEDRSNYGMFTALAIEAEQQVQEVILELASANAEVGSPQQQVGDLYASWMDTDTLNARGTQPLEPFFAEIRGASSHDDIAAMFASLHHPAPYGFGIIPDLADPTRYTVFLGQGGLGLPDRDYYLDEENEAFGRYREAYVAYIETIFDLAGIEGGAEKAAAIMELETRIAGVHWTQAESRDIQRIYNPMTLEQMDALAPALNLSAGMASMGLAEVPTFLVAQPSAIEGAATILTETPIELWQDYMIFHTINNNTARLPLAFDEASFDFFGRTLNGTPDQRPRDLRGVNLVGGQLGEVVGQVYVERHFPPSSKTDMEELVSNLTTAFEGRLNDLEWMDDETRANALRKLSTFEPRIGYPDNWRDHSALEVRADDLFGNMIRLAEFNWNDQVEDLMGPVDRTQWPYPPQTVNASYNPLMNQITFPAGILQAPFFDPNADAAINYGAIGAVIGHEIGHGFDDQGRRFDYDGSVNDWWSGETNARFEERAGRLGAQYDGYSPVEGMFVNGTFTMGENIGDLGGLQMAYTAYRNYVDENHGGEAPIIDGFTGDQRFFLAWAQVWRRLYREDNLISRLSTDPHSPSQYRTNGVVRNLDEWYEAFNVGADHALYLPPEERVKIW